MLPGISSFPQLLTGRLLLRKLEITDAEQIFSLRSNDVVNKYLDRPKANTVEDAKAFIQKISFGNSNNHWIYWAICFHNQPQLMGTICLWNFSEQENKSEIGYELLPEFHNKGIMQEAFSAVVKFAFDVLKLNRIEAWTVLQNESSIKILKRNYFERDNELEDKIDRVNDGPDTIIFSLSKKAYLNRGL